jgi:hypothetical protein
VRRYPLVDPLRLMRGNNLDQQLSQRSTYLFLWLRRLNVSAQIESPKEEAPMASYPEHIRNGHKQLLSPAAAVASLLALLGVALIAIMVARGTHRIELGATLAPTTIGAFGSVR